MGLPLARRFLVFRLLPVFIFHFSFFIFHSARAQGVGPDKNYYLVHDFADDWQVYDEGYKNYVPYVPERHQNYSSFSLFLSLETNRYYELLCFADQEEYLFINASLQRKLPASTWTVLNLDSLYRGYRTPEIFLTFYGPKTGPTDKKVLLGYRRRPNQQAAALVGSTLLAKPREINDTFINFFILAGLLLLFSCTVLYNAYQKAFIRFYSLRDLLTVNPRDPALTLNRTPDISSLLFVLHLSFVLSYAYILISNQNIDLFSTQVLLRQGQTITDLFINFLEIAVLMFVLFIGKYTALTMLGGLYRFEKVVNYHFFKIIQASSIFFTGLVLLMAVAEVSWPGFGIRIENYLFLSVVLFFLLRLGLLYFSINRLSSVKNLYLFSYLCIVELIPIIVGIRFAL
ncbi:MAG: DUF4271 domain-containing protein [Cytophagaceae bacterium]|nr:DUF4271 domain-containing protein [Cytophagaceae bacterium]